MIIMIDSFLRTNVFKCSMLIKKLLTSTINISTAVISIFYQLQFFNNKQTFFRQKNSDSWFSAQTLENQNLKLDGLRFCGRDASIFQACDFAFLLTYHTIFLMDKHYHLLAYRKKSIYDRISRNKILYKSMRLNFLKKCYFYKK